MGQSISLQLNRTLSIAPALQRSLQLLQMNALEFEQEISQALDSNPLLEMEEGAEVVEPIETGEAAALERRPRHVRRHRQRDIGRFHCGNGLR